jgi:hypothetical protein
VKTSIVALSAAALIAAAPALAAQGVRTPGLQHQVAKKHAKKHHVAGYARPRAMRARDAAKAYPGAFGYAPGEAHGYLDRDLEVSGRQAGGGSM